MGASFLFSVSHIFPEACPSDSKIGVLALRITILQFFCENASVFLIFFRLLSPLFGSIIYELGLKVSGL